MKVEKNGVMDHQEIIELIGTATRYGTLLIGGLCLLVYSNQIGQFPEGISLGEGLAFYMVCAGFLLAYALYVLVCTATGCLLMAWPAQWLQRRAQNRHSKQTRRYAFLRTDYSSMRDWSVVGAGIVGLFGYALVIISSAKPWQAALWLGAPVVQGIGVMFLLTITRRHQHLQSGLVVANQSDGVALQSITDTAFIRRVFMLWLALAPLVLSPEKLFLFDAAFKVAQLRKEAATVHVKSPWSNRVLQSTLPHAPSVLGTDYVEFKKVNVLLRSVGEKVVIELPTKAGISKLSLPADAVHIE